MYIQFTAFQSTAAVRIGALRMRAVTMIDDIVASRLLVGGGCGCRIQQERRRGGDREECEDFDSLRQSHLVSCFL